MEGALIQGRLVVEEGCLGVEPDAGAFVLVLWTDGIEVRGDELVGSTGARFRIGDLVQVGGGESPGTTFERGANPDLDGCLDATDSTRVWVGGWPIHVDGPLL